MKPEEKQQWEKRIQSARTPEDKAKIWREIMAEFDRQLTAKGLSDAEREALIAEIMHGDD
jgi:hypothetical protein